ncbi:MAG: class E sortase [Actinomycetota bacterium]|nr:class E sortase [Actinomycetota bacterium]
MRRKGQAPPGANKSVVPFSLPPGDHGSDGPDAAGAGRVRLSSLPLIAIVLGVALTAGSAVAMVRAGSEVGPAAPPAKVFTSFVEDPAPTTTTLPAAPAGAPAAAPRTTPTPPPPERAKEPLVRVGEIRIPRIGLVHPIYEGVSLTVVDHGPGHWPGSAMPGQLGNTVFAGHRVTHSHPFRHVDQLVAGDEVIFATADGEFHYKVTGTEIVGARDTWIVTPTPDATMTLFACHPPGSARQRIVIRGAYVGAAASVLS